MLLRFHRCDKVSLPITYWTSCNETYSGLFVISTSTEILISSPGGAVGYKIGTTFSSRSAFGGAADLSGWLVIRKEKHIALILFGRFMEGAYAWSCATIPDFRDSDELCDTSVMQAWTPWFSEFNSDELEFTSSDFKLLPASLGSQRSIRIHWMIQIWITLHQVIAKSDFSVMILPKKQTSRKTWE